MSHKCKKKHPWDYCKHCDEELQAKRNQPPSGSPFVIIDEADNLTEEDWDRLGAILDKLKSPPKIYGTKTTTRT